MKATIITPTIGTPYLLEACASVAKQTQECLHLIVVDGRDSANRVVDIVSRAALENPMYAYNIIVVPWRTGENRFNGHRIYGSISGLVMTPYFSWLDEDNFFDRDFVETMVGALEEEKDKNYATCRRTVIKDDGSTIGRDNRESIGKNGMGYDLYDMNTFMFKASMALVTQYVQIKWFMGADDGYEGDRDLTKAIIDVPHKHLSDYHGVYYRSPKRLEKFFKEICDE